MSNSVDPTKIYFTDTDRDLSLIGLYGRPYTEEVIRTSLSLYALFYDQIVLPDAPTLSNPILRELFTGRDSVAKWGFPELLADGIISLAKRDTAVSFGELDEYMRLSRSWRHSKQGQLDDYAAFLDETCTEPVVHSYHEAGTKFTQLTEACFTDASLMQSLGIQDVAQSTFEYSENRRLETTDKLARRSAIYEYCDKLDERGQRGGARRLRELSSILYHGSTADALALAPAYSIKFLTAAEALYGIPLLSAGGDHVASLRPKLQELLPFYAAALPLLNASVIKEIRGSRQFEVYREGLRVAASSELPAQSLDRFYSALAIYLNYLETPLALVLMDRYRIRKRYKTLARSACNGITKAHSLASALVTGLKAASRK